MTEAGSRVRRVGEEAVVTIVGEIDVTNAGEIRQALLAAGSASAAALIIDMSGTTFCDSAGVQAIIDAHHQASATRTQLRLVATAVLRILTLTGVDQLIPIYPTLEAALAGIPGPGASDEPDEFVAAVALVARETDKFLSLGQHGALFRSCASNCDAVAAAELK